MKNKIIFILVLLFWIPHSIYAVSAAIKKKYPYALLTDDYGILNKEDMKYSYHNATEPRPFSPKNTGGQIYWQCYSREYVEVALKDIGYSSENLDDNDGALSVTVYSTSEVSHKFGMRRNWGIKGVEKRFHRWLELMKGEKYVCLAGESSAFLEERIVDGKKHQEYYWTFERIKTKKGCDSYFEPSNCV